MVSVPEGLETLPPDLVMRRRVHKEHKDQHDMPRECSRLGIHDSPRRFLADLSAFDINHVDICREIYVSPEIERCVRPRKSDRTVTRGVDNGPEESAVGNLAVEPDVLVEEGAEDRGRSERPNQVTKNYVTMEAEVSIRLLEIDDLRGRS
jgi:hypothetical protein